MSWARLDDRFSSHPKVRRLRARYRLDAYLALGWWLLHLSDTIDGRIDRESSLVAYPEIDPDMVAPMLVDVGLLDEIEGGWLIHDWIDYQSDNTLQRLGGKARAATARRDPKTGQMLKAQPAGQQVTSHPSRITRIDTPVPPAGQQAGMTTLRATLAELGIVKA